MDRPSPHRDALLNLALSFMGSTQRSRSIYEKYTKLVRHQIAIIEQTEGRRLQKKDWMDLAIELGTQALADDIGARQIAESIYPVLDRSGQSLARYAHMPAESATSFLLWITGLSKTIDPKLTTLLAQVIGELQALSLLPQHPHAHPR